MKNAIKRIANLLFVVLFVIVVTVGSLPAALAMTEADEFLQIVNGKYDFAGTGTKEDPFQVSSYEDLQRLRDSVDCGVTYRDFYFAQTTDITFPAGENWEPIGDVQKDYAFHGNYDGQGYVLKDVYCDNQFASIFAWLKGEVRNLGIESGTFTGSTIGSIASHGGSEAKIINCYNKAEIIANDRGGGITDNYGGQILYCWNLGEVTGLQSWTVTAGITSYSGYSTTSIERCFTTFDNLVVDSTYSGGIYASAVITTDQIGGLLEEIAALVGRSSELETLSHRNFVFMTAVDDTLAYTDTIPNAYWAEYLKGYMMMALLAVICVVMGIAALILRPWEYQTPPSAPRKPAAKVDAGGSAEENPKTNRKQQAKRIAAIILTIVLFISAFSYVNEVVSNEYTAGVLNFDNFVNSETKPDVLFFGASTMSCNIELASLWTDYGIAGYCLGAGGSHMYDSYYRLLEAEKSCTPKLVVLEVYAVTLDEEYRAAEFQQENISALPFSMNKYNFVNAAVEPEHRIEYLLNLPVFHNRYDELTKWDFLHGSLFGTDDKGTWTFFYGNPYTPTLADPVQYTQYRALPDKSEYYLREIIRHCQEKNIELLLIKTPDASRTRNQPYYNAVQLIADEYDVPFINMNFYDEEIGLQPSDFYYDDIHLNVSGARKCSAFLGNYLKTNYELEDHRSDVAYDSWNRFVANRDTLFLSRMKTKADYFPELARNGMKIIVIPNKAEKCSGDAYNGVQTELDALGYELWEPYGVEDKQQHTLGENTITVTHTRSSCYVNINSEKFFTVTSPGVIVIVYNEVLDEVVDAISFMKSNGYDFQRHIWTR